MKNERKRVDNRGLSLVELLIAIVILAVIVAPLLHAFVMSAKVNAKSKKELRETAVAQDMMEGLKAYSVEDLAYQFNYPNGGLKEYSLSFNIVDPSIIKNGVSGLSANVLELTNVGNVFKDDDSDKSVNNYTAADRMDMSVDHSFKPRETDGKYYFAIKNMNLTDTNVSGNEYMENSYVDVLIVADATGFRDPVGAATHAADKHNSKDLIDIPMMNSYIDAFYVEDSYTTTNNVAAQFFKNKYYASDATVSVNNIVPKMKKSITIETKKTAGTAKDGKDRYEVNVSTEYKLRDATSPGGFKSEKYRSNATAFDNISTGEVLQNIYLFYQPVYHPSADYSILKDEIIYKAATGVNIDWYVVKQGSLSVMAADEENYKCKLKVVGDASTVGSIRTNLNFNAVTNTPITGSTEYDPGTLSTKIKELFGDVKEDRLYDCTVYLFEKGTIDDWVNNSTNDRTDAKLKDEALTVIKGNMK